jgi:nitrite reductase/ring-hydroxylating ferredoxin subunit
MSKIIKVATTGDLSPGTGKVIEVDGYKIALFNVEGNFYAIDNACTHKGGSLGDGELNGHIVTCPLHSSNFNVKTGEVVRPPARTGVKSFKVKVEDNDVFVELE